MAVWIIGLLIAAGLLFIAFRLFVARSDDAEVDSGHGDVGSGGKRQLRPQLERLRSSGRYWGVRIEHGGPGNACDAVLGVSGESYSFEEAPPLPLPGCAAMRCACVYVGLEDRRINPPRRQVHDRRNAIRYEPTRDARRQDADRRKKNKAWTDQSSG